MVAEFAFIRERNKIKRKLKKQPKVKKKITNRRTQFEFKLAATVLRYLLQPGGYEQAKK